MFKLMEKYVKKRKKKTKDAGYDIDPRILFTDSPLAACGQVMHDSKKAWKARGLILVEEPMDSTGKKLLTLHIFKDLNEVEECELAIPLSNFCTLEECAKPPKSSKNDKLYALKLSSSNSGRTLFLGFSERLVLELWMRVLPMGLQSAMLKSSDESPKTQRAPGRMFGRKDTLVNLAHGGSSPLVTMGGSDRLR